MKRLLGLIAGLCISSGAFAEDIKISNLPAGGPIQDADKFPIARAGANYSILGSAFCRVASCTITAPILGPSGATPTYSFSGDSDTGVSNPAANKLGFVAGNVATAYVDATSFSLNPTFKLSFLGAGSNRIDFIPATPTGVRQMLVPDFSGYFSVYTAGITPPDSSTCNDPNETGTLYFQTGSSTVNSQIFRCQVGVLPAWQPVGHVAKPNAPTACVIGNIWFDTDAVAGQNLYGCTSTDTWTLLAGSGSASPNITSGTAVPIAGNCDTALEVGAIYIQSGDPDAVNLQSYRCTQTGAAIYGWKPLGYNSGTTPPATCRVDNLFFKTDATAGANLYVCTATDTWTVISGAGSGFVSPGQGIIVDMVGSGTLAARTITGGEGITVTNGNGVTGNPTVAVDTAVVIRKGFGINDPPASCGSTGNTFQLGDIYLETDTNQLFTCSAVNTWICFNCGSIDPSAALEVIEECLYGNTTSGGHGSSGFYSAAIGAGGSVSLANDTNGFPSHPGLCRITTGATDDAGGEYEFRGSQSGANWGDGWESESWSLDSIVRISNVNGQALYFGVANSSAVASITSSIMIVRDTDLGHGAFVFRVCDSGTTGCQSAGDDVNQDSAVSTIAPLNNTWYRLRVSFDAVNQKLSGQINNETPVTFCASGCTSTITNLPTVQMRPMIIGLTRDTTSKTVDMDYWKVRVDFVTPRY